MVLRSFLISIALILFATSIFAQPYSHQAWQSATISGDALNITCASLLLPYELGRFLDETGSPGARGELDASLRSAHPVKVKLTPQGYPGSTTDNLNSISGCTVDGAILELTTANSGMTITVQNVSGVIEFADGLDVTLDAPNKILRLERKAGVWIGLGFGGGGGGGGGGSGDITAVGDCVSGDCGRFTLSGSDKVDASNIATIGSDRGIIVMNGSSCSTATTAGQLCNQTAGYGDLYLGRGSDTMNVSKNQQTAVTLDAADATPRVSPLNKFYICADATQYTDFVDLSTNDHNPWVADFDITITATATCGINFGSLIVGNNGTAWTAAVGDSAKCHYSEYLDKWSCLVTSPAGSGSGATTQQTSTIIKPLSANTDWVRVAGDTTAPAIGSTAANAMLIDLDNDQVADCTVTKSGGVTSFTCQNTNFQASPGQSGGDIIFNDFGGTACVTLDPDNGTITQGTNCGQLNFGGVTTSRRRTTSNSGSAVTLTGSDCNGAIYRNSAASARQFRLCAGVSSGGQLVCFVDNAGGVITVDTADTSTHIRTETGTNLTNGNAINLESGIGNKVCLMSTSATEWLVLGSVGAVSDGGTGF